MACVYLELSSWRWTSFCAHRCRECVGPQLWFWQWHSMGQTDSSERQPLWLLSSKTFSKITLTVGSTWCTSLVLLFLLLLLVFFFGVFFLMLPSVALWKRAPWKPPHHQQDGRAVLSGPAGGLHPACSSVAQRMNLQLCWVERKITAMSLSLVFICFNQRPPTPPLILPFVQYGLLFRSVFHISWFSG